MTKTEEAKAIITSSYILYLIDALLDNREKFKGSTIALKQKLLGKTKQAQFKPYVMMSNEAWQSVVNEFKDDNMHIVIFDAVEFLAFNEEESMTKMFGNDIITIASRFALKQTMDGVEPSLLKESRIITKALTASLRKVIFNNKEIL